MFLEKQLRKLIFIRNQLYASNLLRRISFGRKIEWDFFSALTNWATSQYLFYSCEGRIRTSDHSIMCRWTSLRYYPKFQYVKRTIYLSLRTGLEPASSRFLRDTLPIKLPLVNTKIPKTARLHLRDASHNFVRLHLNPNTYIPNISKNSLAVFLLVSVSRPLYLP